MAKLIFLTILAATYFTGLNLFNERAQQELSSLQVLYTSPDYLSAQISSVDR